MASNEFLQLTSLIYQEGYRVTNSDIRYKKGQGIHVTVHLANNGLTRTISSDAEDFVRFTIQFQRMIDTNGQIRIAKVRDSERYWSDVDYLVDLKGEKLKQALEAVSSGTFRFTFDPYAGVRKILQSRIPVKDQDVQGVRQFYHETLALVLLQGRGSVSMKETTELNKKEFAAYHQVFETLLRGSFLRPGKKAEPIDDYKRFLRFMHIDLIDLGTLITQQERFTTFLADLLKGKTVTENEVRIIIDIYWRLCELSYPMLNAARIAIQLTKVQRFPDEQPRFEELVEFLRKDKSANQLVSCVEPVLRNAEAHCATVVVPSKGSYEVVVYDHRSVPAKEISRIPFSKVSEMAKVLKYSLVPALYITLCLFDYAFQILILTSYEFKMLLVKVGQLGRLN